MALAAGLATLDLIASPRFHGDLAAKTRQLCDELVTAACEAGVLLTTNYVGGMFGLFFTAENVTNYAQATACDVERFKTFSMGCWPRGYFAPSAFEAGFMSSAHTEADLDATAVAARQVFARI